MQILLNTDTHVDGRHGMAQYLESLAKDELHRFGDRLTRVEAHVTDSNHVKTHPDEIHCTLEARLNGQEPVVVKDHANNAHQAINGAMSKLKRALTTVVDKHDDPRRAAGRPELDAAE